MVQVVYLSGHWHVRLLCCPMPDGKVVNHDQIARLVLVVHGVACITRTGGRGVPRAQWSRWRHQGSSLSSADDMQKERGQRVADGGREGGGKQKSMDESAVRTSAEGSAPACTPLLSRSL